MIDLHDIRYVRLGCSDLDESVRFATDILGLELTERAESRVYVRGDQRAYNICYVEGGVRRITDEGGHVPRQFPPVFSSFWGARPNIAKFRKS